jgi:hypothetical protein
VDDAVDMSQLYEDMHALTAQMVEAAHANRWDLVIELERQVSIIRGAMQSARSVPLSGAEVQRLTQLTQSIIDHIAEVDRHAQPWLDAVRRLLGSPAVKERVENAYSGG